MNYGVFYKQLETKRRQIVAIQESLMALAATEGQAADITKAMAEMKGAGRIYAHVEPGQTITPVPQFRAKASFPVTSKLAGSHLKATVRKKPGKTKNGGAAAAVREEIMLMQPGQRFNANYLRQRLPKFRKGSVLSVTLSTLIRAANPIITRHGGGEYSVRLKAPHTTIPVNQSAQTHHSPAEAAGTAVA